MFLLIGDQVEANILSLVELSLSTKVLYNLVVALQFIETYSKQGWQYSMKRTSLSLLL